MSLLVDYRLAGAQSERDLLHHGPALPAVRLGSRPMCGIAGLLTSDSTVPLHNASETLRNALAHRGPDSSGATIVEDEDRRVLLVATRLAVRDPSPRGNQPMAGRWGVIVTLNGELFNADELRQELERDGCAFRGGSDTEVLLRAYEAWGVASLARLRGMFAIAVWDGRRRELHLARDALGIKPLYVHSDATHVGWSSEIRALLAARIAPPRICGQGLLTYLQGGAIAEPLSIIDGVEVLEPGTTLTFQADGTRTATRWWHLQEVFAREPHLHGREAADALRGALDRAVRRQLVSDVPLGVFLSGGIDSSALVGLAASASSQIRTCSVVFDEPRFSEEEWIQQVVRRYDTQHQQVRLTSADFRAQLPAALAAMDQPTFDGVNTYVVAGLARASGLTVALSGAGGDELWGGYELFRTVPKLMALRGRNGARALPRPLAHAVARVLGGRADRGAKLARWLHGECIDPVDLQREVMSPDVRRALLGDQLQSRPAASPAPNGYDINHISSREVELWLRNVLLRDTDVMSMAHSLEVRVPLLDEELVELAPRIVGEAKLQGDRSKAVFVDAVQDLLPAGLATRPKMGFTLPFETWLRGPLNGDVSDVLLDPQAGGEIGAALDPEAVTRVWRRFEAGKTSWSRPWALYVAKVWGERHL